MTPRRLFHFTCDHGREAIGRRGRLEPQIEHPLLGCSVVWLTTEPNPDREATGLTSRITSCDRMAYRYVVSDVAACRPWIGSPEREAVLKAGGHTLMDLECFGDPEYWWITDGVQARLG